MLITKVEKKVAATCDCCGKNSDDFTSWYKLNAIYNEGIKQFIIPKRHGYYERRSYQKVNELVFCSSECIKNYLYSEMDMLIAEIRPLSQPANNKIIQ